MARTCNPVIRSHIVYTSDATVVAVAGNRLTQRRRAKNITRIDETIHADTAPSHRRAFKKRRCLIPADCFYDLDKSARRKDPVLNWHERRFAFRVCPAYRACAQWS